MLQPFLEAGRMEAGCDEAGRGCLAGPVCAAAVILPQDFFHPLLNDSKVLTASVREELREVIQQKAVAWAVAWADPEEIDSINILNASFLAMNRAIKLLSVQPDFLLIDGNRFKSDSEIPFSCQIKGDGRFVSIAAASVLAKTARDNYMIERDLQYPGYGWAQNKGYPTQAHRQAILELGITPLHRQSFRLTPDDSQTSLF